MPELGLADYLAYCFGEVVRAREGVDLYSRQVADRYAQDAVLKEFPVPRFRVPTLQMSIPVVVAEAEFTSTSRFDVDGEAFLGEITRRAEEFLRRREVGRRPFARRELPRPRRLSEESVKLVRAFHEELTADPARADTLVHIWWTDIVARALHDEGAEDLRDGDTERRLLAETTAELADYVRSRTVVDRAAIDRLVVEPRTTRVREEADETSVVTINVEMVEEGFFLRTVKDEAGDERQIVDFE